MDKHDKAVLRRYVTNLDKNVFGLINMPDVVKGALFSRYSRSDKSLRETLLHEFINSDESNFQDIVGSPQVAVDLELNVQKANDFYNRVLVGYGDDSVAELAGAHIAVENISSLAADELTDARIGISPLEKSARYVKFDADEKPYHIPLEVKIYSRLCHDYTYAMDSLFSFYNDNWDVIRRQVMENAPHTNYPNTSKTAYERAVHAKTADVMKNVLPACRLTNVGLYGNGRAFEYLLSKLISRGRDDNAELIGLHEGMQRELNLLLPMFVKRAAYNPRHRKSYDHAVGPLNRTDLFREWNDGISVKLINDKESANLEAGVAALIEYPKTNFPVRPLGDALIRDGLTIYDVIDNYVGTRTNRRDKPGRAFEVPEYYFELHASYGAYRDFHRHRMGTQVRNYLECNTTDLYIPDEFADAGIYDDFIKVVRQAKYVYREIAETMDKGIAEYCVPRACKVRWLMKMNLRELYHLVELRSGEQGHDEYRKLAQEMARLAALRDPELCKYMMVDNEEYYLNRLAAEERNERKAAQA